MIIRTMQQEDKNEVIEMMEEFYSSPAVHTNGSKEIFNADVNACVSNNPFLEGFVFEENNAILGYGMIAKSFSTEFGKQCIWIEDIFVKKEYRGLGIGSKFINLVSERFSNAIIRLEAEEENTRAVTVYLKRGFEKLPYLQMIKLK